MAVIGFPSPLVDHVFKPLCSCWKRLSGRAFKAHRVVGWRELRVLGGEQLADRGFEEHEAKKGTSIAFTRSRQEGGYEDP